MSSNEWHRELFKNIPLITAVAAALYIALRILSAGGFDIQTAYAILQAAGTGTVLTGAILSGLSAIPSVVLLAYYLFFPGLKNYTDVKRFSIIFGIALFWIIAILITPAIQIALFLLLVGVNRLANSISQRRSTRSAQPSKPETSAPLLGVGNSIMTTENARHKISEPKPEEVLKLTANVKREANEFLQLVKKSADSFPVDAHKNLQRRQRELQVAVLHLGRLAKFTNAYNDEELEKIVPEIISENEEILKITTEIAKLTGERLKIVESRLAESEERIQGYQRARARSPYAVLLTAVFLLSLSILSPQTWLPMQNLTIDNAKPFSGYLLEETYNSVAILRDSPREVIY